MSSTRLVQLDHPGFGRRVALVDGDDLHLLGTYRSVYAFAVAALETGYKLRDLLSTDLAGIALDYPKVWALETEWRFLPSFDHPDESARLMVSGAGHDLDAGPAWFFKGTGAALRGHGDVLVAPDFAAGANEEAEIAAVYLIDKTGIPHRVGLTPGNEFCDPAQAAEGLAAHSKLRPCSIGPELSLDGEFDDVRGSVSLHRGGELLWWSKLATGDCHTRYRLRELEQSLFRYPAHRRPGDVYVYFLGCPAGSYAQNIRLEEDDQMTVSWEGFGRPLVNRVRWAPATEPVTPLPL